MEQCKLFKRILPYVRLGKHSLQKRIFIYFLIFSLSFTFTGFLIISKILMEEYVTSLTEHAVNSSDRAKQSIEFLLNMTDNTASLLANQQSLLDALRLTTITEDRDYVFSKYSIDIMLKSIISVHEYIDNIYILGSDGEFYSSYWGADQKEIESRFDDLIKNQKKHQEYINGEPIVTYLPFFDLNVISYTRPIFLYPEDLGLGLIIIDLNYTYLREMFTFSSLQQDVEKTMVMNKNGETIFTFPFNTSMEHIVDKYPELLEDNHTVHGKAFGAESIILSNRVDYSDWMIIRIISKDKIYNNVYYLTRIGALIWIIFIILSFGISYALSISITNPIINLNNTIQKVEMGNLGVRAQGEGPDEIGQLATSFNHMVQRISDLMGKTLEEQKMKSDLEFQILQSQINPHFLYNTLDSIKWLAVFQNVENISDMATSLINLLKYNISKKTKLVTLSDEINSIRDYLEIQKFRFGDAFDTIYEIGEATEKLYILKFILQPLIENAIFHGFDNIDYQGIIRIRSLIQEEKLVLEVMDNGIGLDEEKDYLNQISSYDHKKMHNSIGIRNVTDRIKLYFGGNASFSLRNLDEGGVIVTIILPLIQTTDQLPEDVDNIIRRIGKD